MTPEHQEIFRDLCTKVDDRSVLDAAIEQLEAENKRMREALARISETLADVLDGSRVQEMQVRLGVQQDQVAALQAKVERLEAELETETKL